MNEEPNIGPFFAPLDKNGIPKRRFEVKMRNLGSTPMDGIEKAVFVDGIKLDFTIDVVRFLEAKKAGAKYVLQIQKEIEQQFIKNVSDAVGRKVTTEEIKAATVTGWI